MFKIYDSHFRSEPLMQCDNLRRAMKESTRLAHERGELVHVTGGPGGPKMIEPAPRVGLGCTIYYASDRHACTIEYVSPEGRVINVREDKATRADGGGMSESQSYTYEPDPEGRVHTFHRNGRGTYGDRQSGLRLGLGIRDSYHDYSF